MRKGIGPRGLGASKSPMKMASPAKKGKKKTKTNQQLRDQYARAEGTREAQSKLDEHAKNNPRAARKMSSEQEGRIRESYEQAAISRRRAEQARRR